MTTAHRTLKTPTREQEALADRIHQTLWVWFGWETTFDGDDYTVALRLLARRIAREQRRRDRGARR
jgi:hypothetical protein